MVVTIRIAKESDANAVLNIYKPYVEKTAITFDYDIPSFENFKNRMKDI
ncbi:GNAT family N-acetyltransferase [Streptococcus uberis]